MNPDLANQAEEKRNRLLRRGDWRFLLPDPWPIKSVCFDDGLIGRSAGVVSSQILKPEQANAEDIDLATAVDPDARTLSTAQYLLRPGGSFYGEWKYIRLSGSRVVRQTLEKAGFTDIRTYWAWPAPERASPSFWLPLDAPQALNFFLRNRPPRASVRQRLVQKTLATAWQFGRSAQLLAPVRVTARKPESPSSVILSGLEAKILDRWSSWRFGNLPGRFSKLLLTGGGRSINKAVVLFFADQEQFPSLVVKFPRSTEAVAALEREDNILQAVHTTGASALARIPEVLLSHRQGDQLALVETPVLGHPLYVYLRPENYRKLALQVTDWLASLMLDTQMQSLSSERGKMLQAVLSEFELSFDQVLDLACRQKNRALMESLVDLPITLEQRDCSPWNLLINQDGDLAVLDWESAELNGFPGLDLIYFLTYLAFFLDGSMESGLFLESYRRAKDPETFTGRIQAECEQRYFQLTGIDLSALSALRLLTWLVHTRSEHAHMVADFGKKPQPDQLKGSLFYRLWHAELLGIGD